jgi:hypothetical protein
MNKTIYPALLFLIAFPLLPVRTAQAQESPRVLNQAVDAQRDLPGDDVRPIPEPEPLDLVSVSEQLASVEDLFAGGGSMPVTFDSVRAKDRGTDAATIELAEELSAYTNDLMRAADDFVNHRSTKNPMDLDASSEKYPMVRRFFDAATAFHAQDSESANNAGSRVSALAQPPVHALGWCSWLITDAACTCGHWLYPQPNHAAQWKNYTSTNPTATLQGWGYHQTPSFAGGNWTRAQTYYPSRCGNGTYRDQAIITGSKTFKEQNYAGFTPRGEPNPEFWTSWVWPYPAWPTYVQWWHAHY